MTITLFSESKKNLKAFNEYAQSLGSGLVVVLVPHHLRTTDPNYFDDLKAFLTENGIEYLDVSRALSAAEKQGQSLYWVEDPHLNIAGNKIVADELTRYVRLRLEAGEK